MHRRLVKIRPAPPTWDTHPTSNPLIVRIPGFPPAAVVTGQSIKFTVDAVANPHRIQVKSVTFYVDSNSDQMFDSGDAIVGKAKKTKNGWTVSIPTEKLLAGNVKFYAIATTKNGA